jgi:hypothetical protein
LISESDAHRSCCTNHASHWINKPHFADGLIECDGLNFAGSETNHSAEFPSGNELDGFDAKSSGQDPVKRAG